MPASSRLSLLISAAAVATAQDQQEFPILAEVQMSEGGAGVGGSIMLAQVDAEMLEISYKFTGLMSGEHGFHIHSLADFSDGCASTGKHYNPFGKTHGGPVAEERHVGDLGNVAADDQGLAEGMLVDTVAKLYGEHTILGRSMVVHMFPDDMGLGGFDDSSTTGHAGGRLACGEIAPMVFPITAVANIDIGGNGVTGTVELVQLDAESLELTYNIQGLTSAEALHGFHVHVLPITDHLARF
jgi:Cu-Zn family superoxide dismutase